MFETINYEEFTKSFINAIESHVFNLNDSDENPQSSDNSETHYKSKYKILLNKYDDLLSKYDLATTTIKDLEHYINSELQNYKKSNFYEPNVTAEDLYKREITKLKNENLKLISELNRKIEETNSLYALCEDNENEIKELEDIVRVYEKEEANWNDHKQSEEWSENRHYKQFIYTLISELNQLLENVNLEEDN